MNDATQFCRLKEFSSEFSVLFAPDINRCVVCFFYSFRGIYYKRQHHQQQHPVNCKSKIATDGQKTKEKEQVTDKKKKLKKINASIKTKFEEKKKVIVK